MRSEHPLGKAIVARAVARQRFIQDPERFDYTPGLGITASVGGATVLVGNRALLIKSGVEVQTDVASNINAASEIFVARNGHLLGAIVVADTIRTEARHAMASLGQMNIRAAGGGLAGS